MRNLGVVQIDSAGVNSRVKQQAEQKKQQQTTLLKQQSVSFFDEAWSGHQIAQFTGDNLFTDWLQNKDKVCTDGKDDGKLSAGQYALSFAKGLIGGIPKAMINHPLATVAMGAVGAGAIALTGGAILPVLGALGVASGVGMAGYGGYKSLTAKTDGEAKQALETMGLGVTTTTLSMLSAGKALEKAAEAGVKSAQVSKDANIFQKTLQMFKAIPECLTKSKEWTMSYIKGIPVNIELADGTKQVKVKGKLVEETLTDGTNKKYCTNGNLSEESFQNGSYRRYDVNGNTTEELVVNKKSSTYYKDGIVREERFHNGGYKLYNADGVITEGKVIEGNKTSIYKGGKLVQVRENLPNGEYKIYKEGSFIQFDCLNDPIEEYDAGIKMHKLFNQASVNKHIVDGELQDYRLFRTDYVLLEKPNGSTLIEEEKCIGLFTSDGQPVSEISFFHNGNYYTYSNGGHNLSVVDDSYIYRYQDGVLTEKIYAPSKPIGTDFFRSTSDLVTPMPQDRCAISISYRPDGRKVTYDHELGCITTEQPVEKESFFDKLNRGWSKTPKHPPHYITHHLHN